jgi:hypothetical protein
MNGRFGSNASIPHCNRGVRSSLDNGHSLPALIISVAAWAYQRRCRLCCRPVPRCAATLPIAHRYSCPAPPRRASSTPYRFPLAGARFHPARADRDLPAAFLGAAAFAQGVLQGLSSDDPVRFGPFPARCRCCFRFMLVERGIIAICGTIGSPPCPPTSISTSAAVCHCDACCSAFGNFTMYFAASRSVTSGLRPGNMIGSKNC